MDEKKTLRLDRLISSQSSLSRNDVKKAVSQGRATVNGAVTTKSDYKVNPESDHVSLDGQSIEYAKYLYIMMNKPPGVLSASRDKWDKTVIDLLPEEMRARELFPAGRLDKDTTGFVLLTDDGGFAHRILSPKSHISKTYEAIIDRPLTGRDIRQFEEGMVLADGTTLLPAIVTTLPPHGDTQIVEIILREGKYHQIKRMIGAIGARLILLKRTKIGGLELDKSLKEGDARIILHNEIELLLCNSLDRNP